ncbi:MAG TPA: hypothetical protein DG753_07740, partial [Clostridium sp.]|nr:hypothetical protein [Clostridium sp.]
MTKKSLIKLFIIITFSLILFYFILGKISGFEAYIKNDFDKYISVEITNPDGTVNYYDSNEFPLVNKGDIVYATVNLPRERYVKNSILCFHSYHSIVNVYDSNGNLLYDNKDKRVQEDEMIGGTSVFVHIPEEDWGKTYTIRLDVQKNHAFSKIQEVVVIDSVYAYKYLIGDKQAEIMLFMAILVISIMILFVLIFNGAWNSIKGQGIFLLSFLSLVSLWLLGHNNVLDLLSDNTVFNINLKYIALFSSPVMLSLFFYEQNKRKSSKRMHLAFALMNEVFVIICILLYYTTVNFIFFYF